MNINENKILNQFYNTYKKYASSEAHYQFIKDIISLCSVMLDVTPTIIEFLFASSYERGLSFICY